jgi:integrase
MALKVEFFIRSKKEEDIPILVRVRNGRKFDYTAKTKEQISLKHWNESKGMPRESQYAEKNEIIKERLEELKEIIITDCKKTPDEEITSEWLKTRIDKLDNPDKYVSTDTLFGYIQKHFVNDVKYLKVTPRREKEYAEVLNTLKKYKEDKTLKELDFHNMDDNFYHQFSYYLEEQGLKHNTVTKKIKVLKVFLNKAYNSNIHNFRYFKMWKPTIEDVDNIALTEDELQKLYDHDFSDNKRLEKVRDKFIIGCWTGFRVGNLQELSKDDIHGDFFHFKISKSPQGIFVPIFNDMVKNILDKYNGLPPSISDQKFNEYIKEVCEIAKIDAKAEFKSEVKIDGKKVLMHLPKYNLVSSHTMRRTFCTVMYKRGVNIVTIMAISGHKSEKVFLKYIKVSQKEHAERLKAEMEAYENKKVS